MNLDVYCRGNGHVFAGDIPVFMYQKFTIEEDIKVMRCDEVSPATVNIIYNALSISNIKSGLKFLVKKNDIMSLTSFFLIADEL